MVLERGEPTAKASDGLQAGLEALSEADILAGGTGTPGEAPLPPSIEKCLCPATKRTIFSKPDTRTVSRRAPGRRAWPEGMGIGIVAMIRTPAISTDV